MTDDLKAGIAPGGCVTEYPLAWPGSLPMSMPAQGAMTMPGSPTDCCPPGGGSTHELVFDPSGGREFWVSGQKYDHIAQIALDGSATYFAMPPGSAPHGSAFDRQGRLWVTFEGLGKLALIRPDGTVERTIDVKIQSDKLQAPLNPHPHGLTVASDGFLWFTGKLSNTIGRADPDSEDDVTHYALPTPGAVPIYVAEGPDGSMWCTELGASSIGRIAPDRTVTEIAIPTPNSRPITIRAGPDGRSMWFTQEAGGKIGRIDMSDPGKVIEYPVPLTHRDAILGGHVFDSAGDLWVQQYISPPATGPTGDDYIVRIDRAIAEAPPGDLSGVAVTFFKAPSRGTVMHRITVGPDGGIWFTELGLNRIGKVVL